MRLVPYNEIGDRDVDFTHDRFLCKSGDIIFLSHLEFDEEDGYYVINKCGQKYFMYGPHTCEAYLIAPNEEEQGFVDLPEMVEKDVGGQDPDEDLDGDWSDGPPYDAATRTGMYDYD